MSQQTNHAYEFGPFQLLPEERLLLRNGSAVPLSPKDMDLLLVLVESRGRLLQKDELMKHLWPESFVEEANLSHHVFMLRKALNDHGDGGSYIKTVPKHGYRFGVPVREVREDEKPATLTRRQSSSSGDGHAEENLSPIPDRLTSDRERKLGIGPKPASQETLVSQESPARRHWLTGVFAVLLLAVFLAALAMTLIPPQRRWWGSHQQRLATRPTIQSLAVLPFTNASGDPTNEYLSDGITESLINRLSRLPRLRVVARTSAFSYKNQQVDPQTVGRQLQVNAMVTGRVLQRGDSLSIQVDLVNTADGSQLWGEQYSRKITDIVAVQEEIATEISNSLRPELTPKEQTRLTHGYTENSEAYQLYLKGRYHWNKRTAEGLKKGIEYFRQAIESDPQCAPCYAGLADSYNMLSGYRLASPKDSFPHAKEAARRALKIDGALADAHTALGYASMYYDWNWPDAEREFKQAIELNPNYAFAHHWYGIYLQAMRRHDEAIAEMKRALELDPLSLIINSSMSWVFGWAGRYDEAIDAAKNVVDLDPSFVMGHVRLGGAYERKQMYQKAVHELQKAVDLTGRKSPMRLSHLAHVYGASGQRAEALELLNELSQLSTQSYVPAEDVAWVYTGLGDKDLAFVWWQKAYEERALEMVHLQSDPGLNDLRSDPRFAELVRRVGLPP